MEIHFEVGLFGSKNNEMSTVH